MVQDLTIERCRKLIEERRGTKLTDQDIKLLVPVVSLLAGVIADAFSELETVDQSLFNPPGDTLQQLNEGSFIPKPPRKKK